MVLIGDRTLYKAVRLGQYLLVIAASVGLLWATLAGWSAYDWYLPFIGAYTVVMFLEVGFSAYDKRYAKMRAEADDPERQRRRDILAAS